MKLLKAEIDSDIEYTFSFKSKELKTIIDCLEVVLEKYDELDEVLLENDYNSIQNVTIILQNYLQNCQSDQYVLKLKNYEFMCLSSVISYIEYVEFDIFNLQYSNNDISDLSNKMEGLLQEIIKAEIIEKK